MAEQAISQTRRFTPINDGVRGHLIGWDEPPQANDQVMIGTLPYKVEEVRSKDKGGIWTASLEVI